MDITDPETRALFQMMGEPFTGETHLQDGWIYRDPSKMKADLWDQFLGIIGEGNYRLMTYAEYDREDGIYKRGQMLINPTGVENLQAHTKSKVN